MGPGSGCNAHGPSQRLAGQVPGTGALIWGKVLGAMKQGAQLLRYVPNRAPLTPAQLGSSRPLLMLGLPPPSFPLLTLARILLWAGAVCDTTKLRAAFPHVTKSSSSWASLPWPLLTLQEGRSLGAAGHPLRLL